MKPAWTTGEFQTRLGHSVRLSIKENKPEQSFLKKSLKSLKKNGAREMTQWLRALAEDLDSGPSTHMVASVTTVPGDLVFSSGLCRHQPSHGICTTGKQGSHIHKINH